ncbi:Protein of uncharacterised function (DUF3289) [Cedecea neteri]|uniref:DUF3289 domain-containing protein n=1 Tax=Cedecea neteri TaxID=158822 RepID=A0A291E5U3_9ENTR|nr:DUF3289 family protein [Cedecea neteri]ATF95248.1 DUF3289 domain-containing protein [Cedecea neteri]SQA96850.1 Protein of uncharacterised function (DUF3289) [Cedecea neteri]
MPALRFPCTIFKSQKKRDDYLADDMRYGDLSDITPLFATPCRITLGWITMIFQK